MALHSFEIAAVGHDRVSRDSGSGWVAKVAYSPAATGILEKEERMYSRARLALAKARGVKVPLSRMEGGVLMTEFIEGADTLEHLLRAEILDVGLRPMLAAVGAALAHLHLASCDEPADPERPLVPPLTIQQLSGWPALPVEVTTKVDPVSFDRARRALHAQPGSEKVFIHGDFKPDNILLRGGGAFIIDWERAGAGTPEEDHAAFFAAILTYRIIEAQRATHEQPGAAGELLGQAWKVTGELYKVFAEGYRSTLPVNQERLNLLIPMKLLARAQMMSHQSSNISSVAQLLLSAAHNLLGKRAVAA